MGSLDPKLLRERVPYLISASPQLVKRCSLKDIHVCQLRAVTWSSLILKWLGYFSLFKLSHMNIPPSWFEPKTPDRRPGLLLGVSHQLTWVITSLRVKLIPAYSKFTWMSENAQNCRYLQVETPYTTSWEWWEMTSSSPKSKIQNMMSPGGHGIPKTRSHIWDRCIAKQRDDVCLFGQGWKGAGGERNSG